MQAEPACVTLRVQGMAFLFSLSPFHCKVRALIRYEQRATFRFVVVVVVFVFNHFFFLTSDFVEVNCKR